MKPWTRAEIIGTIIGSVIALAVIAAFVSAAYPEIVGGIK